MPLYESEICTLDGDPLPLSSFKGQTVLMVNVASKCGLTPQYSALERVYERFKDRGFSVLGFPCNQFGSQEPGTPEEIASFCETKYQVTFPLTEKIEVNGVNRHPIYQELVLQVDSEGKAGDITWNFEKFLVGPDGSVAARFRPMTAPDDPELIASIERLLSQT